jgi:hypothetical protein
MSMHLRGVALHRAQDWGLLIEFLSGGYSYLARFRAPQPVHINPHASLQDDDVQMAILLLRVAINLNSACVLLRPGIPRELLDPVFLCIWHVDTDIRVWPWERLVAALQDLCTVREILARDIHRD